MGLDFEAAGYDFQDTPRWSYSGFHRFRKHIARQALDVDLDLMEGFGGYGGTPPGTQAFPDHPLTAFLSHSDCDGEMTPQECIAVADALHDAVAATFTNDPADSYNRHNGLRLAKMMRFCSVANTPLVFT